MRRIEGGEAGEERFRENSRDEVFAARGWFWMRSRFTKSDSFGDIGTLMWHCTYKGEDRNQTIFCVRCVWHIISIDVRGILCTCCSVLQRVAACRSVLHRGALCCTCCSVLQRVAACCSVLNCVAVCCSVMQCVRARAVPCAVAVCCSMLEHVLRHALYWRRAAYLTRVAVCCYVIQCVAVCCSLLPCVAVCCSVVKYLYYYITTTCLMRVVLFAVSMWAASTQE